MTRKEKEELLYLLEEAITWMCAAWYLDLFGLVSAVWNAVGFIDWSWDWVLWLLLIRPILIGGFVMLQVPLGAELENPPK